ncbi:carbohydrate kinase family protein [Nocardioides caldifontis]|uniref:carbohydrate kinase family protein n=1 Tax=Nocardioides caldifontis TaxID=2588938 RepID=UPI001939F280|nr:carbohydrate kinase [Nocardioides caldifontis]
MRPRFVVVGESLVDVVVTPAGETRRAPGGSPLNVAVGLSRLDVPTTLVTEIGDDALGRLVVDHVLASDVALPPGSIVPGRHTSTATAYLDASGAATYDFDLAWELEPRALPEEAGALHVGSLGTALRPGRDQVLALVEEATRRELLVSYDPNARPSLTPDPGQAWRDVREVAAAASIVKLSDEDLGFLTPGTTPEELARLLLQGPTRLVVVTSGGSGAWAFSAEAQVHVASRTSEVVDTVGAGDSFMAALLAVVVEHGLDDLTAPRLQQYVEAAHEAAAVTVSRLGADPPRRSDLPSGWPVVG